MEPTPSFVDVRNVSVSYAMRRNQILQWLGRAPDAFTVLKKISFQLQQGDHVTLYGGEGSGKTTLLRVLAGGIRSTSGSVRINEKRPIENLDAAAGYVSSEESEKNPDTVHSVLHAFGVSHQITNLPARLGEVIEHAGLTNAQYRVTATLSTAERLRVNAARAALSDAPVILLDDAADELGSENISHFCTTLFKNRTVIVATRHAHTAEALNLPIMLIHNGIVAQSGTADEIATAVAVPRILDVWVEGIRYDLFRQLKKHTGVRSVQLLPSSQFSGQRLRITLESSRYLPRLYDVISKAPLVQVEEIPPSLAEIVDKVTKKSGRGQ